MSTTANATQNGFNSRRFGRGHRGSHRGSGSRRGSNRGWGWTQTPGQGRKHAAPVDGHDDEQPVESKRRRAAASDGEEDEKENEKDYYTDDEDSEARGGDSGSGPRERRQGAPVGARRDKRPSQNHSSRPSDTPSDTTQNPQTHQENPIGERLDNESRNFRGGRGYAQRFQRGGPRGSHSGRGNSHRTDSSRSDTNDAKKDAPATSGSAAAEVQTTTLLCISDTKGRLDIINRLIEETGADYVIHCGDFGFYDDKSHERLSFTELRNVIANSSLSQDEKSRVLALDEAKLRVFCSGGANGYSLSDLQSYDEDSGSLSFRVPVFAVFGNQEDVDVVEPMLMLKKKAKNLFVLHERTSPLLHKKVRLLGLGGAINVNKLFDHGNGEGIAAGAAGAMWTTMLQIGELCDTAETQQGDKEIRLLITHVSPGREPLLEGLARHIKADISLSGGGNSVIYSYNEAGVHSSEEVEQRNQKSRADIDRVWRDVEKKVKDNMEENQVKLIEKGLKAASVSTPTNGYLTPWYLNLPAAKDGYALLTIGHDGKVAIETKSSATISLRTHRKRENYKGEARKKVDTPAANANAHADKSTSNEGSQRNPEANKRGGARDSRDTSGAEKKRQAETGKAVTDTLTTQMNKLSVQDEAGAGEAGKDSPKSKANKVTPEVKKDSDGAVGGNQKSEESAQVEQNEESAADASNTDDKEEALLYVGGSGFPPNATVDWVKGVLREGGLEEGDVISVRLNRHQFGNQSTKFAVVSLKTAELIEKAQSALDGCKQSIESDGKGGEKTQDGEKETKAEGDADGEAKQGAEGTLTVRRFEKRQGNPSWRGGRDFGGHRGGRGNGRGRGFGRGFGRGRGEGERGRW